MIKMKNFTIDFLAKNIKIALAPYKIAKPLQGNCKEF
jgi:hypothetical protein